MRFLLVFLVLVGVVFGAEEKPKLKAEVEYEKQVAVAAAEFEKQIQLAKMRLIYALREELKKAAAVTPVADTDLIAQLGARIKELEANTKPVEVVKDDPIKFSNFIGTYKGPVMGKEGSYRITYDKGVYVLEELVPHQFKSVNSITFKNLLLFQWPNNEDLISVELIGNSITFICWKHGSQGGLIAKQPSGEYWWKSVMKKVN